MTTEDQSPDWTVDQCFRSVSSDPDVSQTPAPQIHRPSVNPTVKRFMMTTLLFLVIFLFLLMMKQCLIQKPFP